MKRVVFLFVAVLLVLPLCACNNETVSEDVESAATILEEIEEIVEEETQENSAEQNSSVIDSINAAPLAVGEVVTIEDNCEFSIESFQIVNEVLPPSPNSFYTYYTADDGKVYVDISIIYKNLKTADVSADKVINGKLIYSDRYEYQGFSIIEDDNRGNFTYTNITNISPLTTEYIHYLFSVPEELQDSSYSITAILSIAGSNYKLIIREGENGVVELGSVADSAVEKKSGSVALAEPVKTNNSIFKIDFANITNDVIPPFPDNFYTHYEADSGKIYVDVCFAYENLLQKSVDADDVISATLSYANKYDFTGFTIIEENSRGSFTYTNITGVSPLCTEYIHYLFEVPSEVAESNDPIEVNFSIDGNDYSYQVR